MVDYSKWDNFTDSEEEEEETRTRGQPTVHRLDSNSGSYCSGNVTINPPPSSSSSSSSSSSTIPCCNKKSKKEEKTEKEAYELFPEKIINGSHTPRLLWSQSALCAAVSVLIPADTKPNQISFFLSTEKMTLKVGGETIVDDTFAFPITLPEGEDTEYMWELTDKTSNHRLLEVKLTKKSLMPGMIIWWDRVFSEDPKIDVKKIAGRPKGGEAFKRAWEDAHTHNSRRM